jgi:DNA replication and repair protein RecF
MRERNRLLKDGSRDAHWYAALESQMAQAGTRIARNREATVARLMQAQGQAETAFPRRSLAITYPEDPLPPSEELSRRRSNAAAGATWPPAAPSWVPTAPISRPSGPPRASRPRLLHGRAEGALVSLILANARAIEADGTAPLLLLDEVAAHLDPARRAALYDEVCGLGLQAFMTGTEPALFAELGTRAQVWEASEQGGVTTLAERSTP